MHLTAFDTDVTSWQCGSYNEVMPINPHEEDPLDAFLDAESEEEFGSPILRDRLDPRARQSVSGDLSNWSAEDFSSLYVRFWPHLLRHARRYISNEALAEEVVQDAFLYLMTSLPELDSELGVLKFLKWKIRLLCYDILGSKGYSSERLVSEMPESGEVDGNLEQLERADDAAVVRLALAKLNPRQREALISSVYEEKSTLEIADQMGLNANAVRQLIHRARNAFRVALVGEASLQGLSTAQILSVAARKARSDAPRIVARSSALLLAIAIGLGGLNAMTTESSLVSSGVLDAVPDSAISLPSSPTDLLTDDEPPNSGDEGQPTEQETSLSIESQGEFANGDVGNSATISDTEDSNVVTVSSADENARLEGAAVEPVMSLQADSFVNVLSTSVENAGIYTQSYSALFSEIFAGTSIEVFGGTGISAFLDLDTEERQVREILFQVNLDGNPYVVVPKDVVYKYDTTLGATQITINASSFYMVGTNLRVFSDSPLSSASAKITLTLNGNGEPASAAMEVSNPNTQS